MTGSAAQRNHDNEAEPVDTDGEWFDEWLTNAINEHRFIATMAPIISSARMADPKHLADALDHVAMYLPRYPALLRALQERDLCEVGHQLDRAVAHYIADAAQDEACDMFNDEGAP